ncbi:MAG: hypothetical protein ACK4V6_17715 [Microthrixaceae bacterium]
MTPRRWSLALTVFGGLLLLGGVSLLVTSSMGRGAMSSTNEFGRTVMIEYRTPSIWQDAPRTAVGWLVATVVFVIAVGLLIRFGGIVAAVAVAMLMWLMVMASILTIGVFLAPGAAGLGAAAAASVVDRANRSSAAKNVPPSNPSGDVSIPDPAVR